MAAYKLRFNTTFLAVLIPITAPCPLLNPPVPPPVPNEGGFNELIT